MAKYRLTSPTGETFEITAPDTASQDEVLAYAQANWGEEQKKKSGFMASVGRGAEGLASSIGTGVSALFGDADEAAKAGAARGAGIDKKYEDQVSWDKVAAKYNDPNGGLLPAAGEALRQVPYAIGEQLPNLGATVAGAKLGSMAGAPFGPPGAAVGAVAGAALPNILSSIGSNVERQAQENPNTKVDVGAAGAAGAAQGALDTAAAVIPLGRTVAGKLFGPKVAELLKQGDIKAAEALAREGLTKTVGKGGATYLAAEVPTEVAQQALERLQAGLPLTTPDAIKEYGETAYKTALAAPIGVPGRAVDRSAARSQVQAADVESRIKERQAAQAAEAQRRASPEYLIGVEQRYQAAEAKRQQLEAALKAIPNRDATEEQRQDRKALAQELSQHIKTELQPAAEEYRGVRQQLAAVKEAAVAPEERFVEGLQMPQPPAEAAPLAEKDPYETPSQYAPIGQAAEQALLKLQQDSVSPEEHALIESGDMAAPRDYKAEAELKVKLALDALTQDFKTAEQFVAQKGKIPGYSNQDNRAVQDALRRWLRESRAAEMLERDELLRQIAETGKPRTAPKQNGFTEQYGAQYDEAQREKQVAERRAERREVNEPYRKVFGEKDQLGLPKTTLEPTARALAGEKQADPLQNAEIQDAEGNRLPAKRVEGAKPQALTTDQLKEQLKALLRQREAMRATGRTTNWTLDGKTPSAEEQDIRKRIDQTVERIRDSQLPINGGVWTPPAASYGFDAEGRGRVIERVAQPAAKKIQKAPGEGFRLWPRVGAEKATPENVRSQLQETLRRDDLTPEARAVLERAEPLTTSEDTLELLADQLTRINEQGEGTAPPAKGSPSTLRAKPKANPLTYTKELTEAVKLREGVKDEGVQREMFEGKGDIKTTRQAFVAFMKSANKKLESEVESVDAMLAEVVKLPALLEKLRAARSKYFDLLQWSTEPDKVRVPKVTAKAKEIEAANAELPVLWRQLTPMIQKRMKLRGERDQLTNELRRMDDERARFTEDFPDAPALQETALYRRAEDAQTKLNDVIADLDNAESRLNALDTHFKLLSMTGTKLVKNDKPSPGAVEEARVAEAGAREEVRVLQERIAQIEADMAKRDAEAKQAKEALERKKRDRSQAAKDAADARRNLAQAGKNLGGTKVEAISEEQRAARAQAEAARNDANASRVRVDEKNPIAQKKAYERYRASLVQKMSDEKDRLAKYTKKEVIVARKQAKVDALEAQFKETRGADAREAILKKLDEANEALRGAKALPDATYNTRPMYPGQRADEAKLAELDRKLEEIEPRIEAYRASMEALGPRRAEIEDLKRRMQGRKDANTAEAKRVAAREDFAPAIDVDEARQSDIVKARKQGGTKYRGDLGPSGQKAMLQRDEDKGTEQVGREQGMDIARLGKELNAAFPQQTLYEGKNKKVMLHATVAEARRAHPQEQILDDTRGFVRDGIAHLVAENIAPGQALSVLLHELGVHVGFRNAFTAGELKGLYGAVQSWANKPAKSVERQIYDGVQERLKNAKTPDKQKIDETIAYATEIAVNKGVNPAANNGLAAGWLKKVMTSLKNAIAKFLGTPERLTPQQLVNMAYGAAHMELVNTPPRKGAVGQSKDILFSRGTASAGIYDKIVADKKSTYDGLKQNLWGLAFRTQFVDSKAPFEAASKHMDADKAQQAMYYLQAHGQRMNFTSQSVVTGAPQLVEKTRKDGVKEWLVEAKPGANLKDIVQVLGTVADKVGKDADVVAKRFTSYLVAKRVEGLNKRGRNGLAVLDLSGELTQADLDNELQEIKDLGLDRAFEEARQMYNDYNKNLLDFAVQTGALSQDVVNTLKSYGDYVPFYRERGGNVELVIGGETPVRIGSVKDQPHLKELVGGDQKVLDFMTSSVQNTSMLVDMSLRNLAAKNAVYELRDIGMATVSSKDNLEGPDVVHFKVHGKEHSAKINDAFGIPADLLVKGMAGIPTMVPAVVRLAGLPAKFLRKMITASPVYAAKQLFRDSLSSTMLGGADTLPVLGAFKQIGKGSVLNSRGVTGGQIFTGTNEDLAVAMRQLASGKFDWMSGLAKLEHMSMEADALTRRAQYDSYIAQGLSEMQATYLALESMNFNKRGVSPSVHMLNTLIPFFNAQIQGLDVLYKSFRGTMPFNEKLKTREKLITRGLLMFASSLAYAAMMQDDEAYKNAPPEMKYGNWFVRLPGVDEPIKVPIPFELGYVFKALPEALVNIMANKKDGQDEAWKALKTIVQQTIPGGSNYGIPQIFKPAIETVLGKSFYTGRDLESAHERSLLPEARYRDNTSELAKIIGDTTGTSPIKIENLVRGYTSTLGLALMQAFNFAIPEGDTPEKATKRMSDLPVVGTLFQPNDAQGIISAVYDHVEHIKQVQQTFEDMLAKGEKAAAMKFYQENEEALTKAAFAGNFTQMMGKITKYENAVRAADLPADEKRTALDYYRKLKIALASQARDTLGKT